MVYSPARHNPFEDLGMTPQGPTKRVYAQIIQDQRLQLEEQKLREAITNKIKDGSLKVFSDFMTYCLKACFFSDSVIILYFVQHKIFNLDCNFIFIFYSIIIFLTLLTWALFT